MRVEIPYKFPSLNEYVEACRGNKYAGASMKKKVQSHILPYILSLPRFKRPVTIRFTWIEGNKKRDLDNIAFAKKFILDTLVQAGKLKDDNRRCVMAFSDQFGYGESWKVILDIAEVKGNEEDDAVR